MKKQGDFQVCRDSANQFKNVASWCFDGHGAEFLIETLYPYAVNAAFACELYLKAIQIWESATDQFETGHKLNEAFEKLDDATKLAITQEFSKEYSSKQLKEFLTESQDAFIEWRYPMEHGVSVNITGFEAFLKVLSEYVNNLA